MRWLTRILVLVVILALALAAYGTYLVRSSFPVVDGEVAVSGLTDTVEVVRDEWGVPHIYANNAHDLFFAQGHTHAQDRFWQMDFWRHIGAGRLAEMFGEDLVDSDIFLRSLRFTELAEQELEMMEPEARGFLEAYADGVNAYITGRSATDLSFEYAVLGLQNSEYEVEPWTPINTLTWAKLMSWDLSGNLADEVERTVLSRTLPSERVEQLYPAYPEAHPVIVPSDGAAIEARRVVGVPDSALEPLRRVSRAAADLWALTGGGFEGIGSNNWVVSGGLTESGMPLLANDTHLAIQMPSIWYSNGLHCLGEDHLCPWDAIGFTFPGAPGVVIGHNGHIAWGVTTQAVDTQDLFIERVNPEDDGQYEVDGAWVDFVTRRETIVVAGGDDLTLDLTSTRHGPVVSETFLEEGQFDGSSAIEEPDEYVVSLAWQSLQPSTLVEAIIGISRSTNHDEFREAAALWDIAAQNIVYADVSGNIAYQSTGEVPIRASGDGRYPVSGWDSQHDWVGLVPYEELPWLLNPESGFIATANQLVIRPGEMPFLTSDGDLGHRAARIESVIGDSQTHTGATMRDLMTDGRDGGAEALVPYLLSVPSAANEAVEQIQDAIGSWSAGLEAFQTGGDSSGAAAYQATWRHLLANIFHDEMPEEHWPYGGSRWFLVVAGLMADEDDPWWDDTRTAAVEDRDDIVFQSMLEAHAELSSTLGDSPPNWAWGRLHTATFRNQTLGQSGIGPIEWLFNRSATPRVGGTDSVVNAVGWNAALGYEIDWIPSMRMVIDLGDLSASTFLHTTGQSGHAFHDHYDDMIEPWVDGFQAPMRWDRETIVSNGKSTLTMTPGQ